MSVRVVATPLFSRRLGGILEDYAAKGAVRFVARLEQTYRAMVEHLAAFPHLGRARRRTIAGKAVSVREYVLDVGARDFLVLYAPPTSNAPLTLLNIRIGGENRFRWSQ